MALKRITGMPLLPHTCTLCGQGPTDNDGNQRDVIFAEGIDIDWGNSVYICWECSELIADLVGRVTREGFDRLEEDNAELQEKYDTLLGEHQEQEALLDKIREGNKAQKRIREKATA